VGVKSVHITQDEIQALSPGNSCRDTNAHQRFRSLCRQRKMPIYCSQKKLSFLKKTTKERSRGAQHLPPCFIVIAVLGDARKIFNGGLKGPQRKDISNWVAALICRAKNWVSWSGCTFSISNEEIIRHRIAQVMILTGWRYSFLNCGKEHQGQH
jgi:hypothetical protein